jgi:WXXGXW repeat (2 copies)
MDSPAVGFWSTVQPPIDPSQPAMAVRKKSMKFRLSISACALALSAPLAAWSQVSLSINFGPPPLPVYAQPEIPADGYLWTPGYWSWNPSDSDYYWVPGTWVLAPAVGLLWTPGYWGYEGSAFRWHGGYWADHIGFYGGVNYGYGYTGHGYEGGHWAGDVFAYNRSVNNVNTTVVHNVYNTTVVNNYNVTRVSFNGGPGGVSARPSASELQVTSAKHVEPTANQVQHERTALATPTQRASVNHGVPQVAATPRPSAFAVPEVARTSSGRQPAQPVQKTSSIAQRPVPAPPKTIPDSATHAAAIHEPVTPHGGDSKGAPDVRAKPPSPERTVVEKTAAPHPEVARPAEPQARAETPHPQTAPQAKVAGAKPEPRGEDRPHE